MQAKLVRDHCPAVLDGMCSPASTDTEYQMALVLKLHEEAQEIADFPENPEEYADLLEVLLALAKHNGVEGDDILDELVAKRASHGGFEDGQIWEGDESMKPPYPAIVVDVNFNIQVPMAQDFGFAPSKEQVASRLHSVPYWLHWAMSRVG